MEDLKRVLEEKKARALIEPKEEMILALTDEIRLLLATLKVLK
jgi:hypothetical protein